MEHPVSQRLEAGGECERGVWGTDGVLTGYNEAVKRVVIKKTTLPPKVREKRTCKYILSQTLVTLVVQFV